MGRDDQPFRVAARDHPGLIFGTSVSEARAAIQQVNHELQPSRDGPVFRSWVENCFNPKNAGKVGNMHGELELLTVCLDELMQGRIVELADVLASRIRFLTVGIDKGCWETAKEFLVYRPHRTALISENMLDVAHYAALKRLRREKRAGQVNKAAGR